MIINNMIKNIKIIYYYGKKIQGILTKTNLINNLLIGTYISIYFVLNYVLLI